MGPGLHIFATTLAARFIVLPSSSSWHIHPIHRATGAGGLKVILTRLPMASNFDDELLVTASASRHGVSADDALHAFRNTIFWWEMNEGLTMHIGPSESGQLLEVGVVADEHGRLIVHAMKARAKFLPGRR